MVELLALRAVARAVAQCFNLPGVFRRLFRPLGAGGVLAARELLPQRTATFNLVSTLDVHTPRLLISGWSLFSGLRLDLCRPAIRPMLINQSSEFANGFRVLRLLGEVLHFAGVLFVIV